MNLSQARPSVKRWLRQRWESSQELHAIHTVPSVIFVGKAFAVHEILYKSIFSGLRKARHALLAKHMLSKCILTGLYGVIPLPFGARLDING